MFILPWLHTLVKSPTGTVSHRFHFFLENGGTQLLSVEESEADTFCIENGLIPQSTFSEKGVRFVNLDSEKVSLPSFYSFHEEEGKGLELWRTFLWIGEGEEDDPWGVNKQLDEIRLSNISVAEIIQTILRRGAI